MQNITFEQGGNLMLFQQQMDTPLVLSNSEISDILYGGITVKSFDLTNGEVKTKLTIENMTAEHCDGQFMSLINLEEGAEIEVYDSSFSFISNNFEGAVLLAGYRQAIADIYDSEFFNNTSIEGGVIMTKDESHVSIHNCTFRDNFSIGSAVIKAEFDGQFSLYD